MVFPNKGENHYSGIQNEKMISHYLNNAGPISDHIRNLYLQQGIEEPIYFEHAGGTARVDDCVINVNKENNGKIEKTYIHGISFKNHQKSGTIDWINTSKKDFIPKLDELKETLKEWKHELVDVVTDVESFQVHESHLRRARDEIILNHLQLFENDSLKHILQNIYDHYVNHIIITRNMGKNILYYEKSRENFKEMIGYPEWTYYIKMGRAKNSAQIWRKNGTIEVNTHLRIRLVLNNGLNAFLGFSKSNTTSIPCIKIQQDNMEGYMASLQNVIVEDVPRSFVEEQMMKKQHSLAKEVIPMYQEEGFDDNFALFNALITGADYTFGSTNNKEIKILENEYLYLTHMLTTFT